MPLLTRDRHSDGPALLWLHVFTQTGSSAAAFTSILAGSRKLLTPDLPGHGAQASTTASLPDTGQLLVPQLGSGADLGGYSFGGRVALHVALAAPHLVRRLVLLSTTLGIADDDERMARRRRDEALATHIRTVGADQFLTEWLAQPLFAGLSDVDVSTRSRDAEGLARSLEQAGTGTQAFLGDAATALTMPALIMCGQRDAKFVAAGHELVDTLPHAQLAIVPNACHAAHLERPDYVAGLILEFLASE